MKKKIAKLRKSDRLATLVHLADGVVHDAMHANAHIQQVSKNSNNTSRKFNTKHAVKHAAGTLDHAKRLKEHMNSYDSLKQLEKELEGKKF